MKSLVILKPDSFRSKCWGQLLHHFETLGEIVDIRMVKLTPEFVSQLYSHLSEDVYTRVLRQMVSDPSLCIVMDVENVQELRHVAVMLRKLYDSDETNPACNVTHASDSQKNGEKEVALFFEHFGGEL
jgi:nucleoside diphosphate kinase